MTREREREKKKTKPTPTPRDRLADRQTDRQVETEGYNGSDSIVT